MKITIKKDRIATNEQDGDIALLVWPHDGQVNVIDSGGNVLASVYRTTKSGQTMARLSVYPAVQQRDQIGVEAEVVIALVDGDSTSKLYPDASTALRAVGAELLAYKRQEATAVHAEQQAENRGQSEKASEPARFDETASYPLAAGASPAYMRGLRARDRDPLL